VGEAPVLALIHRVRLRIRLARALAVAARLAVLAAALFLIALLLAKLHLLPLRALLGCGLLALMLPLAGALATACRRVASEMAAKRIDLACGLDDRIGSALAFLRLQTPDPFMRAHIRDAARHATGTDPRTALPIHSPPEMRGLAVLVAALIALGVLRFPERHLRAAYLPQASRATGSEMEAARALARDLEEAAHELKDPELNDLTKQIDALLQKLASGDITRKEFFEKLAELEQRYLAQKEGDFEALKDKLRKSGEALAKEKPTRELGQALKKDDLDKAKRELDQLAQQAQQQKLDPAARKEAARALEQAAERQRRLMDEEQKKAAAQERALAEQQRDLEKLARENPPKSEAEKRRLEDQKRELQRLQKENRDRQAQRQNQQRQLQRLSRNLADAAQQMSQGQSGQAAQSLQQAAGEMSRIAQQLQRAGEMQRVKVQLADLKEALRRAGQQGKEGRQGKMGQFLARAGGKPGQGKQGEQLFMEGEGQPGEPQLLLPGQGGKSAVQLETDQPGAQSQGQTPERQPGEGIGSEHDPNLQGAQTKLASKKRDVSVEGKQGAGPTRSEVIYGAADKGFATRSYKRVYTDYTQVVEEVMSREQVPLGMRYFVKRYFNLIKPRE